MTLIPEIPQAVLEQDISRDSILAYLQALDPARLEYTEPTNMEMFLDLLCTVGYRTIRDLHEPVTAGWTRFLDYEKNKRRATCLLSGTLALFFTLLIADEAWRAAAATAEDYEELADYLLLPAPKNKRTKPGPRRAVTEPTARPFCDRHGHYD